MAVSSLQNRVVILTGCSSGIGLSTARIFLERQALVFGVDIGAIPQKLADAHETFTFHQTNLVKPGAADEVISACLKKYGRIDVLVNCAGIVDGFSSADTFNEDEWDRVMAVNLKVPARMMKAVLPTMKEQKSGSIVNVVSKAGTSGSIAGIAYTASKHGLAGATKNVAWRFRLDGIRCNGICPGGVPTNITSSMQKELYDADGYNSFSAVHELHNPKDSEGIPTAMIPTDDVAHGIVFLASDEAKSINGALVPIDNAWSTI